MYYTKTVKWEILKHGGYHFSKLYSQQTCQPSLSITMLGNMTVDRASQQQCELGKQLISIGSYFCTVMTVQARSAAQVGKVTNSDSIRIALLQENLSLAFPTR